MKPQKSRELFRNNPPDLWFEEELLFSSGYQYIAGIDEAGRGPLAGPVVAACVCAGKKIDLPGVNDSKKLNHEKRLKLKNEILAHKDLQVGVGIVEAEEIDRINILQASLLAFKKACDSVQCQPDFCLIDGNHKSPYLEKPQKPLVKGDSRSFLIAAASIIAKETRDDILKEYHQQWPEYEFSAHKGYPTKRHLEIIKEAGILPVHRKSFAPVKKIIAAKISAPDSLNQRELF